MKKKKFDVDIKLHDDTTISATDENGNGAVQTFHAKRITSIEGENKTTLIPYHAIVKETVTETTEEVKVEDTMCVSPTDDPASPEIVFTGVDSVVINVGDTFNVMSGVSATKDGESIEVTANPTEVDTSKAGNTVIVYTAENAVARRTVTVKGE